MIFILLYNNDNHNQISYELLFYSIILFEGMNKGEQIYENDRQAINQYCSNYNINDQHLQDFQQQQELSKEQEQQEYHNWKVTQSTKYQTFRPNKCGSLSPNRQQNSPNNSEYSYQSNSPIKNYIKNKSFCTTMIRTHVNNIINKEEEFEFKILKIQRDMNEKLSAFRSRIIKSQNRYHNSQNQIKKYVTAKNYIAIFTDSKQPFIAENIHQKKQIASLTKIMTAYTVLCICQQFGIKVREHYIPVNTRASYMEGTSANLRSGEEILIIDLLYGLLLPSGNDASIALAQYFGKFLSFKFVKDNDSNEKNGFNMQKFNENRKFYDMQYQKDSIKLFVFEMNKYAYDIGMISTKFVNPSGLSHAENYSTAHDLAILTSLCLKNHLLRLIFKRKIHKCNVVNDKLGYNRQVIWKNTNKLLYRVKECIGVKTGITPGAGPCLSSAFRIGSKQLVVIVLESNDSQQRFNDSERIYKWCRQNINHHADHFES